MPPPTPAPEAPEGARLAALYRTGILDTIPEPAFDDLVALASHLCNAPIALVAFVDADRQWIKAKVGFAIDEMPRAGGFCTGTVEANSMLVIEDAREVPQFAGHPLVSGPPHIRFYAGAPVVTSDRQPLGALCVIDVVPRTLRADQVAHLHRLAGQVSALTELAASVRRLSRVNAELDSERSRLRGVLRAATEYSIIGTDPRGTILVFNEGAERLLGYRAAEVVGLATPLLIHDPAEVQARAAALGIAPGFDVFVAAAREGGAETRQWTYVRKDGRRIPVSMTVTTTYDDAGVLTGFMGIARDITEERRAEEARVACTAAEAALDRLERLHAVAVALAGALKPSEVVDILIQQAVATLGASSGVVVLLREDGRTLDLVAARGRAPEQLAAFQTFSVTTPLPVAMAVRRCAPVFVDVKAAAGMDPALLRRWLGDNASLAATPLLLEGEPRPLGGFCVAFAEHRIFREEDRIFLFALGRLCAQALEHARLYEAEGRARAEAEAANRAKDIFLSTLSHELRTPLTSVLGWAQILRAKPLASADLARGFEIIERNARAQLRLVEDILDVSRIVTGKLEIKRDVVNLAEVVRMALDVAKPTAETATISLLPTIDALVEPVTGDADRLQQVVWNLLSNALKFTPKGGRVEVRLDQVAGRVRIQVVDTGKGIAPSFLPHLFERFQQEDSGPTRARGGLGLGLSIVKSIVEMHGGSISATSLGPDQGATFTVLLPSAGGVPEAPDALRSSVSGPGPGSSNSPARRM